MNYVLGLDVGIGSVGWAVVRNDEKKRIEDFGVRIFESGESSNGKDRSSQERRGYRSNRRLVRRRSHRKWRVKAHLEKIGLVTMKDAQAYFETNSPDIISVRVRALDEKVSPQEIAACLINICNRRGYQEFYEENLDDMSKKEKEEYLQEHNAIGVSEKLMAEGNYRTVAEMIYKDDYFKVEGSDFRRYRNSDYADEKIIFTRKMLRDEVCQILEKQSEFYPQLTEESIRKTVEIIFSQRDFEDGPGDPDDKMRRYTGFLDSLGNCSFYKEEKRGKRFTLLADVYSLTNVLSQYLYIDKKTNQPDFSSELAQALLNFALTTGTITSRDVKKIAKEHGFDVNTQNVTDLSKCLKFTKAVNKIFEDAGYDWAKLSEEYADENSFINQIGELLSDNITPKRRKARLEALQSLDSDLIESLVKLKVSGTTNVCYRYMRDCINAFLDGESYGVFQARINKELESKEDNKKRYKTLPPFEKDYEFFNNPVVLRSINETRKIINAIVRKYGSPYAINIEVGKDLNKSYENRLKDQKNINDNSKKNEAAKKAVAQLLGVDEAEVSPAQVERYKLAEEQGWICLYSGKKLAETDADKVECIKNTNNQYEVDHIVPFSLILDDTLSNKVLVRQSENQTKGQRTPLMYLENEKRAEFIKNVNRIYAKNPKFRRKYKYLMLQTFDSELLSEWKSRNLNDTRYISKFLVNYISNNLEFDKSSSGDRYARSNVYAVKGAMTSMLRRQWLNENTWGIKDKKELKEVTYLDHAVDAIVIANCMPVYVEIAALNKKLRDIFYSAGRKENDEYKKTLEKAIETLFRFYRMPQSVSTPLLTKKKTTPSLIPNLRTEVDKRVTDCDIARYFDKRYAEKNNTEYVARTDEEIEASFRKNIDSFYFDDAEFAKTVHVPLISLKQDKKVNKKITADNPISIKVIDGVEYKIVSKPVLTVKKKEIANLYTNDTKLIEELSNLMADFKDESTISDALAKQGKSAFVYNGKQVNKLKVKAKAPKRYFVKNISDDNHSVLDNTNYYCTEVYKTENGKTNLCAIAYTDLVQSGGKLYLRADYKYPEDYFKHEMYLFPSDYLRIEKGSKITEGYYRSVKAITRNDLYFTRYNKTENDIVGITKDSNIKKISVDLLGKKGGVVEKCGEPLSLITEKD